MADVNQPGRMRGQLDADVTVPKIAEFMAHYFRSQEESKAAEPKTRYNQKGILAADPR
jgi:hypothetical protein